MRWSPTQHPTLVVLLVITEGYGHGWGSHQLVMGGGINQSSVVENFQV